MATENNEKYFYMKLKENFFTSDEIIILEGMPDGYLYSNILLKLYLKSLKNGGKLMLNEFIPYSSTMISQLTGHSVGVVEKALNIFQGLGLIDVLDNGAVYMLNIQNFIGKSSTEADRKRNYRKKIEEEKRLLITDGQMSGQIEDKPATEIEKEIELEKELEIETEKIDYSRIINLYNDICISFPRLRTLSETRKKSIKARINSGYSYEDFELMFTKAEASTFLKGGNDRDWSATFDWMLKDSNMAKILDGNYDNKKVATPKNQQKSSNPFLNRLKEMGEV